MKAENIVRYVVFGFVGALTVGFLGVRMHYKTYARDNYEIAECKTTHKFVNLTTARSLRWAYAFFVDHRLIKVATALAVYPFSELDKAGWINSLYQQVSVDENFFFGFGYGYDDRAVVIVKTIPSNIIGEEPLYCVLGKDYVTIDLLRTDPHINVATRLGRKSDFDFEPSNIIISWGPYWR